VSIKKRRVEAGQWAGRAGKGMCFSPQQQKNPTEAHEVQFRKWRGGQGRTRPSKGLESSRKLLRLRLIYNSSTHLSTPLAKEEEEEEEKGAGGVGEEEVGELEYH